MIIGAFQGTESQNPQLKKTSFDRLNPLESKRTKSTSMQTPAEFGIQTAENHSTYTLMTLPRASCNAKASEASIRLQDSGGCNSADVDLWGPLF